MPESPGEWLPEGHVAFFVNGLVRRQDLAGGLDAGPAFDRLDERQGRPHDPQALAAVLLYACGTNTLSARKIAAMCETDAALRTLSATQLPSFRALADFRQRHREALQRLFPPALLRCVQAGFSFPMVARASNAPRPSARPEDQGEATEAEDSERLEADVSAWLRRGIALDAEEDGKLGAQTRGDELPEALLNRDQRLAGLREAKQRLAEHASNSAMASTTPYATSNGNREGVIGLVDKPPPYLPLSNSLSLKSRPTASASSRTTANPKAAAQPASPQARGHLVLLALLAALALGLRLYGIHWDQGALYHPDERAILDHVQRISFPLHNLGSLLRADSTWNPAWFPYGSFPLYVMKVAAPVAGWFGFNPHDLAAIGRGLSAIADTGTVLLVYAVAARFFRRWAGLLGAAFIAFAPLHIWYSHFFVTDNILACLLMASFFFLTRNLGKLAPKDYILASVFFGLALATKASAAPFALVFAAAAAIQISRTPQEERGRTAKSAAWLLAVAAGATGLAFFIAQPYALIDASTYLKDVGFESQMVRRVVDLPYTRQYIDTPAYLYQVQQLGVWGFGLPLGVLAWLGLAFSLWMAVMRRQPAYILLTAWVVPYFLVTGSLQVKFLRYMLAITPFMAVMAAGMSVWALAKLAALPRQGLHRVAVAVLGGVVLFTGCYGFAYDRIYAKPHPANAMTAWIQKNVPRGATLMRDSGWEEGLRGLEGYSHITPPNGPEVYDDDTPQKREKLISALTDADYVIFYSNRQYGTVPRLPQRYPLSTTYYQQLFAGQLGFQLVHWETAYPNLLGVSFVDDTFSRPGLPVPPPLEAYRPTPITLHLGYADESLTVYDHPMVLLFKKTLTTTAATQRQFYDGALPGIAPTAPTPSEHSQRLLMSPATEAAQQAGGTWSHLFNRASLINQVPILFWYILAQTAFLLTLPITLLLFGRLADRGYLLGKTLSFLLMAYIPWLLASLHILAFTPPSIVLGLTILTAISSGCLFIARHEMLAFLRERWRLIVGCEVLFLAALLGFYAIRTWNPDLWEADQWVASIKQFGHGGEKPMDFAFFNAIVRSSYMPPYDPWFAGGYLNYYYFGWFMNAVPTKLLGIVPSKAIVIAVPMFFALTVAGAFSLGYNLCALAGKIHRRGRELTSLGPSGAEGPTSPLAGAVQRGASPLPPPLGFPTGGKAGPSSPRTGSGEVNPVAEVPAEETSPRPQGLGRLLRQAQDKLSPNFGGEGRLETTATGRRQHVWNMLLSSPVVAGLAAALFVTVLGNLDGLVQVLQGTQRFLGGQPFGVFDYWRSSRLMPDQVQGITEFPYFTFLFADPHAHLWVVPLTLLALGLSLTIALGSRRETPVFPLLVLGLTLGAILATNSWDVITYAAFGAVATAIGEFSDRGRLDMRFFMRSAVKIAVLGGLAILFVLPYYRAYDMPVREDAGGLLASVPIVGKLAGVVTSTFQSSQRTFENMGREQLLNLTHTPPTTTLSTSELARKASATSPWRYVLIHGLFLFAILSLLAYEMMLLYRDARSRKNASGEAWPSASDWPNRLAIRAGLLGQGWLIYAAAGALVVFLLVRASYTTAGLLTAFLFLLPPLIRAAAVNNGERRQVRLLGYAIIAMPLTLGVLVEFLTFTGDIGRLNTVFKFYLQAWVLFALGSAYGLWRLRFGAVIPWKGQRIAWQWTLAALVIAGLIYPIMATPVRAKARFDQIPPTIDGATYLNTAIYTDHDTPMPLIWDRGGFEWLENNVQGSPVIVEGLAPLYTWGSRVAVNTGLPAVIGWDHHEKQQRGDYVGRPSGVDQRRQEVDAFYRNPDVAAAKDFLRRYDVTYIYVGQMERVYYPAAGLGKFDRMLSNGISLAYENPQVRIYRVG